MSDSVRPEPVEGFFKERFDRLSMNGLDEMKHAMPTWHDGWRSAKGPSSLTMRLFAEFQPTVGIRRLASEQAKESGLNGFRNGPAFARTDDDAIDRPHRRHFGGSTG
jgi:hypothetical protein